MMTTIETYVRRGRGMVRKWAVNPGVRLGVKIGVYALSGFLLSAAALANSPMPLVMGLVCALTGWEAAVLAVGGAAGYLLFWGQAGVQGVVWVALGLVAALSLGRRIRSESPLLMCAVAGLIVSATGLVFQIFREDTTAVPVYLLRVALGAASAKLFETVLARGDPAADWLAEGIGVLALAQIGLGRGFSLGCLAAGFLTAAGTFPAAALAGLALDLARVTSTPMTAALCLAYLTRLIPVGEKWMRFAAPGAVYLLVMGLCGQQDFLPAVALALGGCAAFLLPAMPEPVLRRGETGLIQVRLELMSACLAQSEQLLVEQEQVPIDETALLARVQERACGACPNRKACHEHLDDLPVSLLHTALTETGDLPIPCKKPGRMILELRRGQEQLRFLRGERQREAACRNAVAQQYRFLSHYLQQLADGLPRRAVRQRQQFHPEAAVCSAGREVANGDRCVCFAGPAYRYYILLCDGMGTGLGAAQAGQDAASMLRQMLSAGFPAEYALRSLNSLMTLRGRAGDATVDLAEICLDTGRAAVYKWGAAPSYLIRGGTAEKIGTAGPPPGLSVTEDRETVERLSLRRGEVLILLSDGVDGEGALRRMTRISAPPGELAAKILEYGARGSRDDATVAAVRLYPGTLST
ncbi:MAG: PP2C family protein-serine/threonine phosphatase [Candidatus Faecousia sp.]|nr:PP2C family protein-serine/threonine phosphatase [Candidatus Faecousia sp.]